MADNVAITAGSGTTIATDDVGGAQYQRMKVGLGIDGAATDARSINDYTTAAASPDVGILASGTPDRRFTSVSLATAANSTQTWDTNGADATMIYCGTSTTGTYTFEVSADGSNWIAAEAIDVVTDLWISGTNLTPTANKVYRIRTNAYRTLRARTVTTLGATVALTATLAARSISVAAIDIGAAPHTIGYTQVTKTAQYTTTQTGVALWTPASGYRVVVTYAQIGVGGTTAGAVQLWFGATADTTYTRGTDRAIFDHEFAPSATLKPGVIIGNGAGVIGIGATNDVLRVTDSAAINPLTVTVWGYETI